MRMKTDLSLPSSNADQVSTGEGSLSLAELQIIELFTSSALILGLPKSYGQIYGFLFAQAEPKTMEQVIRGLDISLGSASQGLKALRRIGAVKTVLLPGTKRDAFIAELELKKLLGGFMREQFLPHLNKGAGHFQKLEQSIPQVEDKLHRNSLQQRLKQLKYWQKKANQLAPLLELALAK